MRIFLFSVRKGYRFFSHKVLALCGDGHLCLLFVYLNDLVVLHLHNGSHVRSYGYVLTYGHVPAVLFRLFLIKVCLVYKSVV